MLVDIRFTMELAISLYPWRICGLLFTLLTRCLCSSLSPSLCFSMKATRTSLFLHEFNLWVSSWKIKIWWWFLFVRLNFLLQNSWKEDKKCFDLSGYYSCCLCSGAWNLMKNKCPNRIGPKFCIVGLAAFVGFRSEIDDFVVLNKSSPPSEKDSHLCSLAEISQ